MGGLLTGGVQDGDADPPVRVDVGVEDLGQEPHLGRIQRVVLWERQLCDEHPVLEHRIHRARDGGLPLEVVFVGHRACKKNRRKKA